MNNVSFKKRAKPTLTHKLHDLTHAPSIQPKARQVNLGQGKRNVWIGTAASSELRATYAPLFTNLIQATPSIEAERAVVVTKLRKQLITECGETSPPSLAFERWLLDSLLSEEMKEMKEVKDNNATITATVTSTVNDDTSSGDPLFGPLCRRTDLITSSLVSDLIRATISSKQALQIAQNLQTRAQNMMSTCSISSSSSSSSSSVVVVYHRHTLDITFGKKSKRLLKLNHEHYRKLKSLWNLTRNGNNNNNQTSSSSSNNNNNNNEMDSATELIFHDHLFIMLSRYFAMQGHGFQAACPENVFHILNQFLNVSFECFASPLNCYYGAYCSAFPDVDASFGSSGSFWKWEPPVEGGSFQANPPFVAIIMEKMAEKIIALLNQEEENLQNDKTTRPLSFVVIVPGWLEDEGYALMTSSKHKRAHWVIAQEDHGFCDGAQHQRRDRYRSSPYDTAVFILQNKKGALKFPIQTEEVDVEMLIRQAFATGVPSDSAVARRKRDGRGFADEDGGGGVYKGKKRKKTGEGVQQRRKIEHQTKNKSNKNRKRKKRRKKKKEMNTE